MNGCYRAGIVRLSHCPITTLLWSSLMVMLGTSLISGWLFNSFCPDAAGSGISQLKAAFWKIFDHMPIRVLWVKFIPGVLQIGGGSSLGREDPCVQLAGTSSSPLADATGEPKQKHRLVAAPGHVVEIDCQQRVQLAATCYRCLDTSTALRCPVGAAHRLLLNGFLGDAGG
jgi:CIC family chloride channel protein